MNIKDDFNLLDQTQSVYNLLATAVNILDLLPNCAEKLKMVEAIKVFETTVALVTWNLEDVQSAASDFMNPQKVLTESEALDVLDLMVQAHECSDDDWQLVESCIESVKGV